jgi:magnesium transporter
LGGNVGVQSSTVIVRGMATGWVNPQSVRKILLKEIGTGLLMGIACGVGIGVVAPLLKMASHPIGFIVGTSIFLSFTAAAFIGTLLPILLDKLKIDPATASGPVITGTADVVGVLIYFSLAMLLLDFLR